MACWRVFLICHQAVPTAAMAPVAVVATGGAPRTLRVALAARGGATDPASSKDLAGSRKHAPLRGAPVGTKLGTPGSARRQGTARGPVACVAGWLTGVVPAARLELACRLPSPSGYGPFEAAF